MSLPERQPGSVEQTSVVSPGVAGEISWQAVQQYFVGYRAANYLRPLPEFRLIYVKNPKAACSTILLWLDRLHTGDHDVEFSNVHKQHRLPTVREVGRRSVITMLCGAAYRFSFVRHPLRRLESVYWDKIVRKSQIWRPDVLAALGIDVEAGEVVSFDRFLSLVEQQDPMSQMDPHWRPQHLNLLQPLVTYDHVGRLETFAADLEQIREEAGLPQVPLTVRNASTHISGDSVYNGRPDLVRRVEALYATDFELYGY